MKTIDQGTQKIQKICELLKKESIEPAKKESEALIVEAHEKAQDIIKAAEKQAAELIEQAKQAMDQERIIFQSTLVQAARLSIESLKQEIEQKIFKQPLAQLVKEEMSRPQVMAKLIDVIVSAIDKEGLNADLAVTISEKVVPEEITTLLNAHTLELLKDKPLLIGDFASGIKIKLLNKNITIDMSGQAVMELLASYAPQFRKTIFNT